MRASILVLLIFCLLPAIGFAQSPKTRDTVVNVPAEDVEMNQAIAKARASLERFIATLRSPKSWQQSFLVKGQFTSLGRVEHIWEADITFDGRFFHGVIANEPRIKGLRFKQFVSVRREDVNDWMYLVDNKLVGGYTTRVLRARQTKEEREREDASRPYKIDD